MKVFRWITDLNAEQQDRVSVARLARAAGLQLMVFVIGTLGYYYLTGGEYTLLKCTYMTVVTLTTVGFGEIIPIGDDPQLEVFTIFLIITGMGTVLYFVSTLTAFVVNGEMRDYFRTWRMANQIEKMNGHYIIAGTGETGMYVLMEMLREKRDCVVIDVNQKNVARLIRDHGPVPYVIGDATDDDVLRSVGIERATGVVFSLGNDRDNLFATITARRLSDELRIVTRGEDPRAEQKFLMAGATSVIYTNVLGGMRMAAEVTRPEVTTFLDLMMRDTENYRGIEEIDVPAKSPWVGATIRDINIRGQTDALIVAIHEGDDYHFNPGPDFKIRAHTKLIILAKLDDLDFIENLIRFG